MPDNTLEQLKHKATGERLKQLMKDKGISNKQLAEIAGVTPGAVSQWKSGTSSMSRAKLEIVAAYLQTSPLYLSQGYADDGGQNLFPLSTSEAAVIRALREQIPDNLTTEEKHLIGALRASKRLDTEDMIKVVQWFDNMSLSEFASTARLIESATETKTEIETIKEYITEE